MKKLISAALAVMFTTLAFAGMAEAVPTDVSVRIEGKNATLFDRVVKTDGHDIQAAGDSSARKCDSTNLSAHEQPGPTPTAASVDAMTIIGTDFGASWYDGFEDYFIERWGPEAEDDDNAWWWGILVNREFTPVGGCQYQLAEGDEVLWVYDAFNNRPMLSLDGPATAVVGEPVEVNVTDFTDAAYEGATVGGLTAAVVPVSPEVTVPGTSDADGLAAVTFTKPGWKRLKAYDPADDGEGIADAVPSNSIDICVEREAGAGCTGIAPSQNPAQVGQAPAVEIEEPGPPDPEPTCETDPSLCPIPPDPEGASKLRIRGIDMGTRRIRAGGSAKVSVTVRNAGDAASGGTGVCLRSKAVRVKRPCRSLGTLAPGQERKLTFTIKGAKSLRGPAKLPLRLTVTEDGAARLAKTMRLGVTRKR
ncbi:MAG TPA: hypothetical protein VMF31_13350 [Solirubrobacterales bacterium]|nr:hypothetical protein [Solirubrobacterales bacterium]